MFIWSYRGCDGGEDADPEAALEFLGKHCQWAAVTLGSNGCIAKHGKEVGRLEKTWPSVVVMKGLLTFNGFS